MGKTKHRGLLRRCKHCHELFEVYKKDVDNVCELCKMKHIQGK